MYKQNETQVINQALYSFYISVPEKNAKYLVRKYCIYIFTQKKPPNLNIRNQERKVHGDFWLDKSYLIVRNCLMILIFKHSTSVLTKLFKQQDK